jgi:diguanylate cyclase (GGDEF)-like protein
MKFLKLKRKYSEKFKYIFIFIFAFCSIFSDILLKENNLGIQLTASSIFIFLIIGLVGSNASLLIITIINCILIFINGFNILTYIELLEIYCVWCLYRRNKKNIVIHVLVFWIILALPLIFITSYTVSQNLSIESAFFITLICINRIFNALLGNMLLDYIPFESIIGKNSGLAKIKKLSYTLIYVCIASFVVPIIIFTFSISSSNSKQISEVAVRDLKSASEFANQKVGLWTTEEKNNLKLKNLVQINLLVDMLKTYSSTSEKSVNYYLVDLNNTVITSDNTKEYMRAGMGWLKEGNLTKINSNIYKWTAARENSFFIKNYSIDYAYIYITTVDNLKVVVTIPGTVYTSKSIDLYSKILKIILPILILVGVFVMLVKYIVLNSISKFIKITSDLPQKLKNKEKVIFKKTNISEIDILIGNFQTMVDNFFNMIIEVEETNQKLQESERRLFDQAHFDSLTGLANRHYFFTYVEKVMDNFYLDEIYVDKEGIAFFFMDLDKFKTINDNFGHSVGDKILKEVASRMNNVLKSYDNSYYFAARLGGDEFVIEFVYDNKDEIIKLANNLIEAINEPLIIDENKFVPETSIGICLYPEDGEELENIFINADTSMYKAKYSGGNKFQFHSSIN